MKERYYFLGIFFEKTQKAFAFHYIEKRGIVCYILLGGSGTGKNTKTSVDVPGLWKDDTQASSTHGSPKRGFFLDPCYQDASRRGGRIEDTIVAMLPGHPRDQQRCGGESFVHRLGRGLPRRAPPDRQGAFTIRRAAR